MQRMAIIYLEEKSLKKEKEIIRYCKKNNYKILKTIKGIGCCKGVESFDLGIFNLYNFILDIYVNNENFCGCNIITYNLDEFSPTIEDQSAICNMLFGLGCEVETIQNGIWGIDFAFSTDFKKC